MAGLSIPAEQMILCRPGYIQKKKVKILFSGIVFESQREYIRITSTKKEYISKKSMHEIEDP
jgi:hypothetical protein